MNGWKIEEGMSLRDWFAGMVMEGIVASSPRVPLGHVGNVALQIAKDAYFCADAMLAEREKE